MPEFDWDTIRYLQSARQFEYGAKWPMTWQLKSVTLKRAADYLYEVYHDASQRRLQRIQREMRQMVQSTKNALTAENDIGSGRYLEGQELQDEWDVMLVDVYRLLIGYAVENLLKAILMVTHPEYFMESGKMKHLNSHNLASLCKRCGIEISKEERDILDKLTRYIVWLGKYPVPLDSAKMLPQKREDGTWEDKRESFRGRALQEELNAIWDKILKVLETEAQKRRALGETVHIMQITR